MKNDNNKILENLVAEMKADILKVSHRTSSSIRGSGFRRIPAVDTFDINLNSYNTLLESIGITRRLKPDFKVTKNRLKSANRYIGGQIIRCEKAKEKNLPRLYGTIAKFCIKKSRSFRMSAFHKVFPNGGYTHHINDIIKSLKEINHLINVDDDNLIYRRVYLPKGDTFRPLGVPSGEGRVIMHLGNNFLTLFLKEKFEGGQHAYIPGKGALSAGKEVISKVIKAKYVYEFDIKGFFPNVPIERVEEHLMKTKMPPAIPYGLGNINITAPAFCGAKLLDETNAEEKGLCQTIIKEGLSAEKHKELSIFRGISDEWLGENKEIIMQMMREDGYDNLYEYAQAQGAAFDHHKPHSMGDVRLGLPQGLNTSPTLSILTLEDGPNQLKARGCELLMYADDGIIYSDHPFTPLAPADHTFSESKSGMVRYDGKGLKELKFLGLVIDSEGNLKSETRSGTTFSLNNDHDVYKLLSEIKEKKYPDNIMDLVNTGIFGLITSGLYKGNFDGYQKGQSPFKIEKNSIGDILESQTMGDNLTSSQMMEYLFTVNEDIMKATPVLKEKKWFNYNGLRD